MRRVRSFVGLAVIVIVAYCIYPLYTLWRIDKALKSSDSLALDALVDWSKVQDNLKKDALNSVVLDSFKTAQGNSLASIGGMLGTTLGASFLDRMIEGIANGKTVIDAYRNRSDPNGSDIQWVRDVRFLSPTQFHFAVQNPNEKTNAVRVVMTLEGIEWRITRVVLNLSQFSHPPVAANEKDDYSAEKDDYSAKARDGLKRLIEKPAAR